MSTSPRLAECPPGWHKNSRQVAQSFKGREAVDSRRDCAFRMAVAVLKHTSPRSRIFACIEENFSRDGASNGGARGKATPDIPACVRVASGGWMAARSRIGPWQRGYSKTSNAHTRFIN